MSIASYASNVWDMNEDDRRRAFAARAVKGARKTLGMRDVMQLSSSAPKPVVLVDTIIDLPARATTWRHIIYEVAQKHGVAPRDINSHYRNRQVVAARNEIVWRLRTERQYSFIRIGMLMNRDHTTCIHAFKRHAEKLQEQSSLSPLSTVSTGKDAAR